MPSPRRWSARCSSTRCPIRAAAWAHDSTVSSTPHSAERVALGVGQHYPAKVFAELVPAYLGSSRVRQPRHFAVHILGAEVEVHTILSRRGIEHLLESQSGAIGPHHRNEFTGDHFLSRAADL